MVKRHNRLLVALYVCSDAVLGIAAFVLAYVVRFESGLIPITKGYPPFSQYINILPFIGVLVPFAFHVQGLYRLRRGRSRVDDFFAVFVGSILAVVFGIIATLYVKCERYQHADERKDVEILAEGRVALRNRDQTAFKADDIGQHERRDAQHRVGTHV